MWCKKQKQAKEEFTVVYYNKCTVEIDNISSTMYKTTSLTK